MNASRIDTFPNPQLVKPRDAIIRVISTAICGSDLHLYDHYIPTMKAGDVLGHEFMGEGVAVGDRSLWLFSPTGGYAGGQGF